MTHSTDDDFFAALDTFIEGPQVDREMLLRLAWAESTGDAALDALRRRSLAAQARDEPALAAALLDLEWGGRSHLDLHVSGKREDRHETSARLLGQFILRVSEAVKEVTKSTFGLWRLDGDLGVFAPAAGSVEVIFVEREPPRDQDVGGTPADLWAEGMRRVATLLNVAQQDPASLEDSIQDLRSPARDALRLLAQTVEDGTWSLAGTLTTRDGEQFSVKMGTSAATRLVMAAKLQPQRSYPLVLEGVVDGWRWSSHMVRFVPQRGAAVEAHVPDEWAEFIAEHNSRPGRRLEVEFEVHEFARERSVKTVSYLVAAREVPDLFDTTNQG